VRDGVRQVIERAHAALVVLLLLFVLRPLAAVVGLLGANVTRDQRALIGWFGVRGVGSLYYLSYAITHGLDEALAMQIGGIVLAVLTVSIVVHGISVTPMMNRYARRARATTSGEHALPHA
jgi:sodium/hydrogen antiporter